MKAWPLLALLVLASCTPVAPDPTKAGGEPGVLDLRTWDFGRQGAAIPQTWLWDADTLWTPREGRPAGAHPETLGPPERGGSLNASLRTGGLARATIALDVLVVDRQSYALQIGALPGRLNVWVNGVVVWSSEAGAGTILAVQPVSSRLSIVATVETTDPLVGHSELNRVWLVGPTSLLRKAQGDLMVRSFQSMFLFLGAVLFIGLLPFSAHRRSLVPFTAFLVVCLWKLVVNVETPDPFFSAFWPGLSPSLYLWLNHGLNLLPFPFLVQFLARQFPEEIGPRAVLVVWIATLVATLWELLPFALLALGSHDGYAAIMHLPWSLVMNLYVVSVVLFTFERIYHAWLKKRALSSALFYGGITIGLLVLVPIPLSYFLPVAFTSFLGWGVVLFLGILGVEVIRLQLALFATQLGDLEHRLREREGLVRFLPQAWGTRLGREHAEGVRPGDQSRGEGVVVRLEVDSHSTTWLARVQALAEARDGLLAAASDRGATWVLATWSETALALALDIHRALAAETGLVFRLAVLKADVTYHVLDAGTTWVPSVSGVPEDRLRELCQNARRYGATVVLDASVKEGLVIGGWRRHRHLTPGASDIELYEGEPEALAAMKDATGDLYEAALARAGEGQWSEAIDHLVTVVRQNPYDLAARTLLEEWQKTAP